MEVLVIALASIMIFGKNLPEVAVKAAAQVVRLRRAVTKMWREAGIEEEIRRVQRDIEQAKPRIPPIGSMLSEADRRRAERARELEELTPRPDLDDSHADGGRDEGWVRGEGEVDDGFRAEPEAEPEPATEPDDPFAARREPDGEVQDGVADEGGADPGLAQEGAADSVTGDGSTGDGAESEPDTKESA